MALILSKLKPEHCTRVLTILPENFAMEVIMRLLQMEAVQKEGLDGVEKTLRTEFMSNVAARSGKPDSHEIMANIFNNFDGTTEERFMAALEKRNEETLGELFIFFILETILLGKALNINPFNQPSVELIKKETAKILKKI